MLDPVLFLMTELILERTGLHFENSRLLLLEDKLRQMLPGRGLDSLLDYYYFLKYDSQGGEEWQRLQSVLAVNETYFWREFDQIQVLVDVVVPDLLRRRSGKSVRIWHAACATGEEPYTTAIALAEAGLLATGQVEILATDFNQEAIEQARVGVYRRRSFRRIPDDILTRYFTTLPDEKYQLAESIRANVRFAYLNLLDETSMGALTDYDVIICRNVFIYFSDAAIRRVLTSFYYALVPEGYLCVAAAESLLRLTNLFELVEINHAFFYQKRPPSNGRV